MRPLTFEDHVFKALGDIGWRRVVMPKGIPPEAVAYWEGVMKAVAESDEWKAEYIDRNGSLPLYLDSAAFGKRMPELSQMYADYMKKTNVIK